MTIIQFIEERYPIKEKLKAIFSDPYALIENEDGLPYDVIAPDEFGHLTKMVYVNEDRMISVMDLISFSREELDSDIELQCVWDIYMSQVTMEEVNFADIMRSARNYKEHLKAKEDMANVLSI